MCNFLCQAQAELIMKKERCLCKQRWGGETSQGDWDSAEGKTVKITWSLFLGVWWEPAFNSQSYVCCYWNITGNGRKKWADMKIRNNMMKSLSVEPN